MSEAGVVEPEATILLRGGLPSLARSAVARFMCSGVLLVVAQMSAIVVARALGPSGKGIAGLLALVVAIALKSADLGLTASGVYYVGTRKYSADKVLSVYLSTGMLIGVTAGAVLFFIRGYLSKALFGGDYGALILILATALPVLLLNNWLTAVLRGQERIVCVSLIGSAGAVFGFLTLLFTLFVLKQGAAAIVWGMVSAEGFGFVAVVLSLWKSGAKLKLGFDYTLLRESVHYGLRAQVGQILQFINYRFDLLVVNYFLGIASVGIYGTGAGVVQVIWQIPNALAYVLVSRVASVGVDEGNAITCRISRQSMLLSLLSAIALAPLAYLLIPPVFGEAFRPAIYALWLLLPGVVALSYYKTVGAHLAGQGHPEYSSYGAAIASVVTLVLDFLLIPRFGINGAALASTVAYVLNAAICIYWFARFAGVRNVSCLFLPQREDAEICGRLVGRFRRWIS